MVRQHNSKREPGKLTRTLSGHTDSVNACAIYPDGRRIVFGGFDKTVKICSVETLEEISAHSN